MWFFQAFSDSLNPDPHLSMRIRIPNTAVPKMMNSRLLRRGASLRPPLPPDWGLCAVYLPSRTLPRFWPLAMLSVPHCWFCWPGLCCCTRLLLQLLLLRILVPPPEAVAMLPVSGVSGSRLGVGCSWNRLDVSSSWSWLDLDGCWSRLGVGDRSSRLDTGIGRRWSRLGVGGRWGVCGRRLGVGSRWGVCGRRLGFGGRCSIPSPDPPRTRLLLPTCGSYIVNNKKTIFVCSSRRKRSFGRVGKIAEFRIRIISSF